MPIQKEFANPDEVVHYYIKSAKEHLNKAFRVTKR